MKPAAIQNMREAAEVVLASGQMPFSSFLLARLALVAADRLEAGPEAKVDCCSIRRKVAVGVLRVHPQAECGVPDSELADVLSFNSEISNLPILAFRFCPWCGTPRPSGLNPGDVVTELSST